MAAGKKLRYRFYREHKYLSFAVSELERTIAKVDFTSLGQVVELRQRFEGLMALMSGHAEHEDKAIHPLLKVKSPKVYETIEREHERHAKAIQNLKVALDKIDPAGEESDVVITQGYQFYLSFRKFVGINLEHLDHEETVIMPEIHKHYTDQELKELVEFKTYKIMTVDEMVNMLRILFPAMNLQDKEAFLRDIQESEPVKFSKAWPRVSLDISEREKAELIRKLDIQLSSSSSLLNTEEAKPCRE